MVAWCRGLLQATRCTSWSSRRGGVESAWDQQRQRAPWRRWRIEVILWPPGGAQPAPPTEGHSLPLRSIRIDDHDPFEQVADLFKQILLERREQESKQPVLEREDPEVLRETLDL